MMYGILNYFLVILQTNILYTRMYMCLICVRYNIKNLLFFFFRHFSYRYDIKFYIDLHSQSFYEHDSK